MNNRDLATVAEAPAEDAAVFRRAQILCAAIQLVARDGADRARLKDIADEAGVSVGLVQHYFRTRHDLMEQTFQTMMGVSLDAWRRLAEFEPGPLVGLIAVMRLHVFGTVTFADRWGFWVELWASAHRDPALSRIAHRVYEMWNEPIRGAIEALVDSKIAKIDQPAGKTALVVLALIDGLAVRSLTDPDSLTTEEMYHQLLHSVCVLLHIDSDEAQVASALASHILSSNVIASALTPELIARVLAAPPQPALGLVR